MKHKNRLLEVMSHELYEKLVPDMEQVYLPQGKILHYPGETIQELYFPIDCLLSITITMQSGNDD